MSYHCPCPQPGLGGEGATRAIDFNTHGIGTRTEYACKPEVMMASAVPLLYLTSYYCSY